MCGSSTVMAWISRLEQVEKASSALEIRRQNVRNAKGVLLYLLDVVAAPTLVDCRCSSVSEAVDDTIEFDLVEKEMLRDAFAFLSLEGLMSYPDPSDELRGVLESVCNEIRGCFE